MEVGFQGPREDEVLIWLGSGESNTAQYRQGGRGSGQTWQKPPPVEEFQQQIADEFSTVDSKRNGYDIWLILNIVQCFPFMTIQVGKTESEHSCMPDAGTKQNQPWECGEVGV